MLQKKVNDYCVRNSQDSTYLPKTHCILADFRRISRLLTSLIILWYINMSQHSLGKAKFIPHKTFIFNTFSSFL